MKRIISIFLTLVFVFGALAGCKQTANEEETETEGVSLVTYQADFSVKGSEAYKLVSALKEVGIECAEGEYEKTIYVGSDENGLTAAAVESVATRANNYNDYSIICNGTDVAIYGASDYSLGKAIDYFIAEYVSEGAITLESNLCFLSQPQTAELTVDGKSLEGMRVVAGNTKYRSIAKNLAQQLCIYTGYHITDSAVAGNNDITVVATNDSKEDGFSETYTVSVSDSRLTITAPTRASLSYAVQHFASSLKGNINFANGTNEEKRFTMKKANATDTKLFKYCGMWQATDTENPTSMVSYWNVAYVEISFTGNAITAEFSRDTTFKTKMDNAVAYSDYMTAKANEKITFFAEGDGVHTLRIYTNKRSNHLNFAGVWAEENTVLSRAADKEHYIQFVGDSISDNTKSFSHRVGDILGWDHSVTAISAIALEDDYGNWYKNNGYNKNTGEDTPGSMADMLLTNFDLRNPGMESAFFKLGIPEDSMTGAEREKYATRYYNSTDLDCKFESGNTPDIVFIFLGTNDNLNASANSIKRFKNTYLEFVGNILKVYGEDTQIVAMNAISTFGNTETKDGFCTCIRETAKALEEKYADNFTFIDRDTVDSWNVEISSDKIHPSENGYNTLTTEIAAYLKKLFEN